MANFENDKGEEKRSSTTAYSLQEKGNRVKERKDRIIRFKQSKELSKAIEEGKKEEN